MKLRYLLLALAVLGMVFMPVSSVAAACSTSVDPSSLVLTLKDFGPSESAYSEPMVLDGNTLWFVHKRDDRDEMMNNPYGAYLYGSVTVSATPDAVFNESVQKTLQEWGGSYRQLKSVPSGERSAVYQRLTSWEFDKETPGVETVVVIQRCNVVSKAVFATYPEFDGAALATRYAGLMDQRIPR